MSNRSIFASIHTSCLEILIIKKRAPIDLVLYIRPKLLHWGLAWVHMREDYTLLK